ncbi:hypothetical protein D3C77_723880 [compost metagenome]
MVAVRPDFTATHRAAFDDDPVGRRLRLYAQGLQTVGHHLDAVGFLDPQLLGTT